MPTIKAYQIAVGTSIKVPAIDDNPAFWGEVVKVHDWSIYTTVTVIRRVRMKETQHHVEFMLNEDVRVR